MSRGERNYIRVLPRRVVDNILARFFSLYFSREVRLLCGHCFYRRGLHEPLAGSHFGYKDTICFSFFCFVLY